VLAKNMANLEYYMSLPYTTIIEPVTDESGSYYVGRIIELDGCMTDGETKVEVITNLQEAMQGWIETKLANGFEVPEPVQTSGSSGKFTLRLPKSLHQRLATAAKKRLFPLTSTLFIS